MIDAIKYADEQLKQIKGEQFSREDLRIMMILAYLDGKETRLDQEFVKDFEGKEK